MAKKKDEIQAPAPAQTTALATNLESLSKAVLKKTVNAQIAELQAKGKTPLTIYGYFKAMEKYAEFGVEAMKEQATNFAFGDDYDPDALMFFTVGRKDPQKRTYASDQLQNLRNQMASKEREYEALRVKLCEELAPIEAKHKTGLETCATQRDALQSQIHALEKELDKAGKYKDEPNGKRSITVTIN